MNKIFRVFIEKKTGFDIESSNLFTELKEFLGIKSIHKLRMLYRYDVQGISENEFNDAVKTVFSDPPQDLVYHNQFPLNKTDMVFAIEYLPGQYDQRSDSAAQCIQILTHKDAPLVRSAKVIIISGDISEEEIISVKRYCINPVDSREADLKKPLDLKQKVVIPQEVEILENFIEANDQELENLINLHGLAMNFDDIKFCQTYFKDTEKRNPTITEIKLLDTYWSDHCRHTTFHTEIDSVIINDSKYKEEIEQTYYDYREARKRVYNNGERADCLMDLATIAAKELRLKGLLQEMDISEEINACSIKVPVKIDGKQEDWLIMFKNETHNHPTEIEPFGGAATCLGGAIRDPLSGRSYVYQAMRVTGSADPRKDLKDTLPGKLAQRTITTTAAKGYCSYGNQIGLATGHVAEIYDEDYVAKRMEIGAVVGAVPAQNVVREKPQKGDVVVLVGGRTGRDGIGGATGSSKAHTESALQNEAEVQKGNPPIERKLQRLFADPEVTKLIKRCNDFGAGGVSVAIGELTDSLEIDLNAVPKKYEGLDGTDLALSESQERMAVVLNTQDLDKFIKKAREENLESTKVADVTDNGRLKMRWNGKTIVDLDRNFLNTNGVRQHTKVEVCSPEEKDYFAGENKTNLKNAWLDNLKDINVASQKGLVEQFDSTIGARTVLHPYGGKNLNTPIDCMVSKLPFVESDTATFMSWGFDPKLSKWSPYHGAMYAVIESVAKIVAAGADYKTIYFTFQEYFEKLGKDAVKWGKPFAALLGAYKAQKAFQLAAIGGKDSMSGSFNDIHVPPTLVSFALAVGKASQAISPEFKKEHNSVYLIKCKKNINNLPDFDSIKKAYDTIYKLGKENRIFSAQAVTRGGVAAAVSKMCFGNNIGFVFDKDFLTSDLFIPDYGSILIETQEDVSKTLKESKINFLLAGVTTDQKCIEIKDVSIELDEAVRVWSKPLENIFPTRHIGDEKRFKKEFYSYRAPAINLGVKPRVFIPVFPGTNCEYDSRQAFKKAGADVKTGIFNNLSKETLNHSIRSFAEQINSSNILMIPGGFSAGDEPEGSGKFIAAVFRNPSIADAVMTLIKERDGLVLGVCNGFQALVKLGLLPFGDIRNPDPDISPTLTFNKLKRHYSNMVRTQIISTLSPWFLKSETGAIHTLPISNGEGRFVANDEVIDGLFAEGLVATQYVDLDGNPSMSSKYNPSGSYYAIEGITSPDGRVLGKMAHSERIGINVSKNVHGNKDQKLFESGVAYFK